MHAHCVVLTTRSHMFEDGVKKGDTHPDAQWRHCVLSLSLVFKP